MLHIALHFRDNYDNSHLFPYVSLLIFLDLLGVLVFLGDFCVFCLKRIFYVFFLEGHHGNRGAAHRLGQSTTPSGDVFLLGYAGLGIIYSRYEAQEQSWIMHSCFSSILTHLSPFSWSQWSLLAGFILIRQVTRHTFGLVQSKLFPVYFYCLMGSNVVSLALYAVYHPRELLDWHESVQVLAMHIFIYFLHNIIKKSSQWFHYNFPFSSKVSSFLADGSVFCDADNGRSEHALVWPIRHWDDVQDEGNWEGAWPGQPDWSRQPEGRLC